MVLGSWGNITIGDTSAPDFAPMTTRERQTAPAARGDAIRDALPSFVRLWAEDKLDSWSLEKADEREMAWIDDLVRSCRQISN